MRRPVRMPSSGREVGVRQSEQSEQTAAPSGKPSFWDAFRSPRLALMLGLGFASGLPNPLTGSTLTAWLASVGVSVETIGLFSLVHLPYNFKFVWAPVLDRFRLPWLTRRRGWMLGAQLAVLVGVGVMGTLDPVLAPWAVASAALIVAFFSATQDIAVDAYRTDLLPPKERASGTAVFVATYRVALIAAGAGALILSDHVSWTVVYAILAALVLVGIVTTLLAPPPPGEPAPPRSLKEAVVEPFREFWGRDDAMTFLWIIMLYKVGDVVAGQLLIKFLIDLDFSNTEIGAVFKGLGLGASIAGSLLGGGLVARWGLKRALIVFGLAQAVANLAYTGLAIVGKHHVLMTAAVGIDNFMNGMGTAAFVAFLMTLCHRKLSATQYALFSSLMTVPGRILSSASGFVAAEVGWPWFFALTLVVSLPALVLLARVRLPDRPDEDEDDDEA